MTTATTITKIAETITTSDLEFFGIRFNMPSPDGETIEYQPGDIMFNSYVWEDGEPTDVELPGSCAIQIPVTKNWDGTEVSLSDIESAIDEIRQYGSQGQLLLIAGSMMQYGDDDGEIILNHSDYTRGEGAVVLYAWMA
jgi:hypothetical protein